MLMKEPPLYIVVFVSAISLITFGVLIGMQIPEDSSYVTSRLFSSEWMKAIVPAFGGLYGGYWLTNHSQAKKVKTLENALYEEAEHVLGYVRQYFVSVALEYKKWKIDLNKDGEVLYGPPEVDFSIFKGLVMALITENSVPNKEHRIFCHNIENNIKSIVSEEPKRVKENQNLVFIIDRAESINILSRLVDTIYIMDKFVGERRHFNFESDLSISDKVERVFELTNLGKSDNKDLFSKLVNEITRVNPH